MECHARWASERALARLKKLPGLQGGIAFWPPLDAWSRISHVAGGVGFRVVPDLYRHGLFKWCRKSQEIRWIYVLRVRGADYPEAKASFESSGTSISLNSFISRPLERFGPRGLWRYALDFLHNYLGYRRLVWNHFWEKLGIGVFRIWSHGMEKGTAVKITRFGVSEYLRKS